MREQFVGERVEPVAGTMDTRAMARGEPGLPGKFVWRGEECAVAEVMGRWKETSGCRSGSDERYVRKHWYHVRTADGREMKLYFERQARSGSRKKARWWLYTVASPLG
jgi:hypothetical protein